MDWTVHSKLKPGLTLDGSPSNSKSQPAEYKDGQQKLLRCVNHERHLSTLMDWG